MAHEVTTNGFAVDPDIMRLEDELGDLAGAWRDAKGSAEERITLVSMYHTTMAQLFERGWNAGVANLGYDQILPDELMPAEFLRQMRVAAQELSPRLDVPKASAPTC